MKSNNIRNFSIIAHIDHGKSTLADRILEIGGLVNDRNKKDQILDSMDIERERGITVKSNFASFEYTNSNNQKHLFNLIDTPGHVDFFYEVYRSLAACEGVLLLVDATQGIQAQTIANFHMALEADLFILPVINKIDLPNSNIEKTKDQIEKTLGLGKETIFCISAKSGEGVKELLDGIVRYIPPPKINAEIPLRALVFDAYFDSYRGVIEKVRVFDGKISTGDKILFMRKNKERVVSEVGIDSLGLKPLKELSSGQVGYIVTGIKNVRDVALGDTITNTTDKTQAKLFQYKEVKPMVFSGMFPVDSGDYDFLSKSLQKLTLNDSSLVYEAEKSEALGFGFRVGYLGLLHMEVIQHRIESEFGINLIITAPSVSYVVTKKDNTTMQVDNPSKLPTRDMYLHIEEPYVLANIIVAKEYIGNILQLLNDKRGESVKMDYLDSNTVQIVYNLPLAEMVFDFYDKLKSASKGYASLDYELNGYKKSELVKLDILVHHNKVDALSMIIHKDFAEKRGREIVEKLSETINKHQFQIAIQAAIGSKIIARENISALRKNVTAKCYGGDITRKRKLIERQKEGKKKMRMVGNVEVPQEAFLQVLKAAK